MRLSTIKFYNFRNFKEVYLEIKKNPIIIVGPNASGKTNFLEVVQVLSFGRSFRARREKDLIRFGLDFLRIEAYLEKNNKTYKIEFTEEKPEKKPLAKKVKINDTKKKIINLVGFVNSVWFSPQDLNIILGAPSIRRRYLNLVLAQVDKKYVYALAMYHRIISNRNQLLDRIKKRESQTEELFFWDQNLIEHGVYLLKKRLEFVSYIKRHITKIYQEITGNHKKLGIYFKSNCFTSQKENLQTQYQEQLKKNYEKDIYYGFTGMGPHRDDFKLVLDNHGIASFGSQGEIKATVLALKKIETEFLKEKTEDDPILLLDDVFSEFDKERRKKLISQIDEQQTFITTTELSFVDKKCLRNAQVVNVEELAGKRFRIQKTSKQESRV